MTENLLRQLDQRLGPLHARQRLAIELDHEAQVFGQGLTFFHLENWLSAPAVIRTALKLTVFTGAHGGMRNASLSSELS
jgi:hypothetical protein